MPGETANGDAVVVQEHEGSTLVALIDALGHGPLAAATAKRAVDFLESASPTTSMESLMHHLHIDLLGSRGAAVLILRYRAEGPVSRIEGCGIGNVGLRCVGTRVPAITGPGIVGSGRMRTVRIFRKALAEGDRQYLFTDGISHRFRAELVSHLSPEAACDAILDGYASERDDSTIVVTEVTRVAGGPH